MTDQSVSKNKRDIILEAAGDLFLKEGFFKVTMDNVAEKAGVAKGTLYLYFKNKDELFVSVIRSRVNNLVEDARRIVDTSSSLDELVQNLLKFGKRFVSEMGVYKGTRERFMELPVEIRKELMKKTPEMTRKFNLYLGKRILKFVPHVKIKPEYIGEIVFSLTIRASILGDRGFENAVRDFIIKGLKKEEI